MGRSLGAQVKMSSTSCLVMMRCGRVGFTLGRW